MEYKRLENGGLEVALKAGEGEVVFRAETIRNAPSGVHANISIGTRGIPLSVDEFNVTREKDRTAALNKFLKRLEGKFSKKAVAALNEVYPQVDFEMDFMVFCSGLWEAHIGEDSGEDVAGDENPSAPPWAIPGLVLDGSMGIWAGDRGANKSTLGRLACQSLRYGVEDVIPIVRKGMAIWVNAEEPEVEHKRQLGNINGALGLPRETDMYTVDARGMGIADLTPRVRDAVAKTGAVHVFIDSISRLAGGNDMNSNSTATMLMDAFGDMPASVTWLAHTGHDHKERMAGSRHFENAARLMVLVSSRISNPSEMRHPELRRGVRAKVYKANGTVPTEPMFWTLGYDARYGLTGSDLSSKDEWGLLPCDFDLERGPCGRLTWEGVTREGVRCSRHVREEAE
jgi:hypothetical protein